VTSDPLPLLAKTELTEEREIMLLAIDIGNTNITVGLYQEEGLTHAWRLATNHDRMPDEYGLQLLALLKHADSPVSDVRGVALASVVPPLTSTFLQACEHYLDQTPFVVDAGVRTGVRIRYEDPKAVGADRVVDAAAVQRLYGGPACVVDFGTATTFDAISREGDYLGGAIAPGIVIAAEALFQRTAKLPRVDLARPPAAIGTNTVNSMQSGLLFGYVGLVEGMVSRFRNELGPEMKVIATGGLAEIIAAETDVIQVLAPWLTLDGLRIVWEMNR
jgi:type III pantothenate kinase